MVKNATIEIEAAANGFIVNSSERDMNCAMSVSGMFVFNEFDDMVKWLGEHFEKPTPLEKKP